MTRRPPASAPLRSVLVALTMALVGHGCDSTVAQCNQLIGAVNQNTDRLSNAYADLPRFDEAPEVLPRFVEVVDAATRDLEGIELSDERLAAFSADYRELLIGAKELAAKLERAGVDLEKRTEVVQASDKVKANERELVERINAYCQSR